MLYINTSTWVKCNFTLWQVCCKYYNCWLQSRNFDTQIVMQKRMTYDQLILHKVTIGCNCITGFYLSNKDTAILMMLACTFKRLTSLLLILYYIMFDSFSFLMFVIGTVFIGNQMAVYRNCQSRTLTVEWVLREWCQLCRAKCLTTILICLLHSLYQFNRYSVPWYTA